MSKSLKQTATKGIFWSVAERFSVQGTQFFIMLVMARLLLPSDYGLVGMITVFIALSQSLIDSGFSQALIRKQDRTETDNCTVFYFNIVIAVTLYFLLFAVSPAVATFYDTPELCKVMRVVSIVIIINALTVVQRALLTAKIDFKTQAKASFAAAVISGILGIVLALNGYGVWALVYQQIINQVINTIILWCYSTWRPKLIYSWLSFRNLFAFGSKLMAVGLIDITYNNIYPIIIGKVFSPADLGHYSRARNFSDLPSSNVAGILQRVTYPLLCQIQNEDARLAIVYRRFLKLSAFVIFPLMCGLAGLSTPLITTLIGEKWLFCSELLTIICFTMMWYPIHSINLNLLQVKGRTDIFLKLEFYKKGIGLTLLFLSIPYGVKAMCAVGILGSLIALAINTYYTGKLIQIGFFKQMRDLLPTLCLSLLMFFAVYNLHYVVSSAYGQLLIGIPLGILIYLVPCYYFKFSELDEILKLLHIRK